MRSRNRTTLATTLAASIALGTMAFGSLPGAVADPAEGKGAKQNKSGERGRTARSIPDKVKNPDTTVPGTPAPTSHSQKAFDPESDFTSRWTRADARQLKAMSDPSAGPRQNSMPAEHTMPTTPQDFPDMSNEKVWVWDSWPLTDGNGDQYSYNGQEIVFSLVADRKLGFDDRHTHARLGYFYRPAGVPAGERPKNGGWTYGGLVFDEGVAGSIYQDKSFSTVTEWSGSARVNARGEITIFFTSVAFYRDEQEQDVKPADPRIVSSTGKLRTNVGGEKVGFEGLDSIKELLRPDGKYYQTKEQNPYVNFRDPYTFSDPKHPGKTFMVFEGNTAGRRGEAECTDADLGYRKGEPHAEKPAEVTASGANYQMGNVGLAVADNDDLTSWRYLPPILSANCVNDQTERPQIYIKGGKYYLFTISHRTTYSAGLDGPEGVYGFVGKGIRSDYQPLNRGSGLALGNPTNLNYAAGKPFDPDFNQHPGQFQAYSHYVMPGGEVQSFIDTIGSKDNFRRGGTLGPTVRLDIKGASATVDRSYGFNGRGAYADVPANRHLLCTGEDGRCKISRK